MLEMVKTLNELVENVRQYQRAVKDPYARTIPSLVRAWYYIPSLDMVGASRFIGYRGMTSEGYEESKGVVDGKITEPHLQETGWFRQLAKADPLYAHAKSLAEALSPTGRLFPTARFYVLKSVYDEQVKRL